MINTDLDITKNIEIIEKLKSDLLKNVSSLYENMLKNSNDNCERSEYLANIIIYSYLLGKRLSFDYSEINQKVLNKLRIQAINNNEYKYLFGDLDSLFKYMDKYIGG